MSILLELSPETEARLVAQAKKQGMPFNYLQSIVERHLATESEPDWRVLLNQLGRSPSLAKAPPLSDEAISRESIYGEREDQQL